MGYTLIRERLEARGMILMSLAFGLKRVEDGMSRAGHVISRNTPAT